MIRREQRGEPLRYRGSTVTAHHMGPDLLAMVNGEELSGFYVNIEAVYQAGMRHVDAKLKAEADEAAKRKKK